MSIMELHEITVTTDLRIGNDGETKRLRQARCTCGWWEILHDETPEQMRAMHDAALQR